MRSSIVLWEVLHLINVWAGGGLWYQPIKISVWRGNYSTFLDLTPWNSPPKVRQSFIITTQKCTVGAAGVQNQILRNLCDEKWKCKSEDGETHVKRADVKQEESWQSKQAKWGIMLLMEVLYINRNPLQLSRAEKEDIFWSSTSPGSSRCYLNWRKEEWKNVQMGGWNKKMGGDKKLSGITIWVDKTLSGCKARGVSLLIVICHSRRQYLEL